MARIFHNGVRVDQPFLIGRLESKPVYEVMVNSSEGYFIDTFNPTAIKISDNVLTIQSPGVGEDRPLQWVDVGDKLVTMIDSYDDDKRGLVILVREDPGVHRTGYPYYQLLKGDGRLKGEPGNRKLVYEHDLLIQLNPDHAVIVMAAIDDPRGRKAIEHLMYRIRRLKNLQSNDHRRGIRAGDYVTIQCGSTYFSGIISFIRDNDSDSEVFIKEIFGSDFRRAETIRLLSDAAFVNHYPVFIIDMSCPDFITHVEVKIETLNPSGEELASPLTTTLPLMFTHASEDAERLLESCEAFKGGLLKTAETMIAHKNPDGSTYSRRIHDNNCGFVVEEFIDIMESFVVPAISNTCDPTKGFNLLVTENQEVKYTIESNPSRNGSDYDIYMFVEGKGIIGCHAHGSRRSKNKEEDLNA